MSGVALGERLRYRLARLGHAGVAGLALAVFAAALHLGGTREREARLAAIDADIGAARSRLAGASAPAATPQQQLARFHAAFPGPAAFGDFLATVNQAAAERGLAIRNADYREQPDAASGLKRYQVSLPMKGGYPQLRGWLADVLNAHASAALDDIQLRRDTIGAPEVEARLRLSFYVAAR